MMLLSLLIEELPIAAPASVDGLITLYPQLSKIPTLLPPLLDTAIVHRTVNLVVRRYFRVISIVHTKLDTCNDALG